MKTSYQLKILQQGPKIFQFQLSKASQSLSFREVFDLWEKDQLFVQYYVQQLMSTGFEAFYWEHPALQSQCLDRPYECVLQRSNALTQRSVNSKAFAQYLTQEEQVVSFLNRNQDARLVVPTQKGPAANYAHLAKFISQASEMQCFAVFQGVAQEIKAALAAQQTIWLSTAGLGVIWLHIRLDYQPKYYRTQAFKTVDYLL